MSGTTKRLDLQFGSFACSVQGFDDPVQPVQQVLQALQNLLEETPELGDAGIQFDAEAIERLMGEVARRADLDERNVEIVPGLIIVHRRGSGADDYPDIDDADRENAGWAQHFASDGADQDAAKPQKTKNSAKPNDADDDAGYVNIFSPSASTGSGASAKPGSGLFTSASDHQPDPVEDIEAVADGDQPGDDPIRNIFADAGDGDGENIFANLMAESADAESGDRGSSINFFAKQGHAAEFVLESSNRMPSEAKTADPVADPDSERGEALFGGLDEQPEVVEADEGYTAIGLAQVAGAESVPELIVSAAAWMVLIKGQTTFSRSDVINVFQAMPGDHEKTLEARVKGFGKAVRNGQLIMIEDGVFGLSLAELERFQRLL